MKKDDPELSRLLAAWRCEPQPTPRFRAEVWARIEAARDPSWRLATAFAQWAGLPSHSVRWVMTSSAALLLTFAVALGAGVGHMQSTRLRTDRMASAYVKKIDPLQMTSDASPR